MISVYFHLIKFYFQFAVKNRVEYKCFFQDFTV